jgi:hypothetical protein
MSELKTYEEVCDCFKGHLLNIEWVKHQKEGG